MKGRIYTSIAELPPIKNPIEGHKEYLGESSKLAKAFYEKHKDDSGFTAFTEKLQLLQDCSSDKFKSESKNEDDKKKIKNPEFKKLLASIKFDTSAEKNLIKELGAVIKGSI